MVDKYNSFIFDMDGVFKCGNEFIKGTKEIFQMFDKNNIPSIILTNECRYTNDHIINDFKKNGITIPKSFNIYTAANCVADFLNDMKGVDYVHILGEDGLKKTIMEKDRLRKKVIDHIPSKDLINNNLFLVIGALDNINEDIIEKAVVWIRCGAKIIITSPDLSDPGSKGENHLSMPCQTLDLLKKIVPCKAYCPGKPNPIIMRRGLNLLGESEINYKKKILFVGDSLDTDIKLAFEFGIDSALVLTGNTRIFMVKNSIIQPTHIFHSIKDMYDDFIKNK